MKTVLLAISTIPKKGIQAVNFVLDSMASLIYWIFIGIGKWLLAAIIASYIKLMIKLVPILMTKLAPIAKAQLDKDAIFFSSEE